MKHEETRSFVKEEAMIFTTLQQHLTPARYWPILNELSKIGSTCKAQKRDKRTRFLNVMTRMHREGKIVIDYTRRTIRINHEYFTSPIRHAVL